MVHFLREFAKRGGNLRVGQGAHDRSTAAVCLLESGRIAFDASQNGYSGPLGKCLNDFLLARDPTHVHDVSQHPEIAAHGFHCPQDIVPGVDGHQLTADDDDHLSPSPAQRGRESAADHVADEVIDVVFQLVVILDLAFVFFQLPEGGRQTHAGAADARFRPAGFSDQYPFGTLPNCLADVLRVDSLFALQVKDGENVAGQVVEIDQARLGRTAEEHDLSPLLVGQRLTEITRH